MKTQPRRSGRAGRIFLRGLVLWTCLCAATRGETLTLATYNVENYVAANRMVDGVYRENYPKPEAAKAALRAVIRALEADVLALQEMGPETYLRELQRDLRAEGVDYPYAVLLEAADPERHVAVLSRRPFKSVGRHADLAFEYFGAREPVKRGLLEVRFDTAAGELALFVVHLKSRFTDRADDPESAARRASEATAVRDRIWKLFPQPDGARFVIAGDCNDAPPSRPLAALTIRGKARLAEIVPAHDSRGETWTHFYRRADSYSRVDYFLVSPGLRAAVVGGRAQIFDGEAVSAASDHRPLVLRLQLDKTSNTSGETVAAGDGAQTTLVPSSTQRTQN